MISLAVTLATRVQRRAPEEFTRSLYLHYMQWFIDNTSHL